MKTVHTANANSMRQTIKIKLLNSNCFPTILKKGDWYDLKVAEDCFVEGPKVIKILENKKTRSEVNFCTTMIPLGVAMQLPEGMEAIVVPRSSTFKKHHLLQANSVGVIDNSYCGNNDEWKFPALALQDTNFKKGERLCQFKICPSQKATVIQKLKWLFSSGIDFTVVDSLEGEDRGGFGSTGR